MRAKFWILTVFLGSGRSQARLILGELFVIEFELSLTVAQEAHKIHTQFVYSVCASPSNKDRRNDNDVPQQ
jgi:hypothetical protein